MLLLLMNMMKFESVHYAILSYSAWYGAFGISPLHSHRWLDGAVVLADVVDDAGDAERTGEAQQVGQEAECDAEDERLAKRFPQRSPDPLWSLGRCALRPLRGGKRKLLRFRGWNTSGCRTGVNRSKRHALSQPNLDGESCDLLNTAYLSTTLC